MKTPKDYFKEMSVGIQSASRWIDIICTVQKESWNEAVDACAENADLADICGDDGAWYQDKESILKLKK